MAARRARDRSGFPADELDGLVQRWEALTGSNASRAALEADNDVSETRNNEIDGQLCHLKLLSVDGRAPLVTSTNLNGRS